MTTVRAIDRIVRPHTALPNFDGPPLVNTATKLMPIAAPFSNPLALRKRV
jgi:hypothetical protein